MNDDEIFNIAKKFGFFNGCDSLVFTATNIKEFGKFVADHERDFCADMVFKYISQTDNMEARGCLASVAFDIKKRGNEK